MGIKATRLLILGASGMLGNAIFRLFSNHPEYLTYGSIRSKRGLQFFPNHLHANIITNVDVSDFDSLTNVFSHANPDIVINCIGLVKQLEEADNPLSAIPINSILPHRLALLCKISNARLIHFSTDCVFTGQKGKYTEQDVADATDLYGRSKLLGEVDYPHAITLRTSIIGHELEGARSLIGWFLAQKETVQGYQNAIFSGLPTVEIGCIIRDFIIPNPGLHGLYHLSAEPINKFDLLTLVAETYGKQIDIKKNETVIIDRSLNSNKFKHSSGYKPKSWPKLIQQMHNFK